MSTKTDSTPTAPAETGDCGRSSLALGSADFLRAEAANYEKISTFFEEQAEPDQVAHVAKLRACADELDAMKTALRVAHNALVWWQAGIEAKQPHNALDEKTVAHALETVRAVILPNTEGSRAR